MCAKDIELTCIINGAKKDDFVNFYYKSKIIVVEPAIAFLNKKDERELRDLSFSVYKTEKCMEDFSFAEQDDKDIYIIGDICEDTTYKNVILDNIKRIDDGEI